MFLIDFLQTIMFTVFGNFDTREEHLLLTMFDFALQEEFEAAADIAG